MTDPINTDPDVVIFGNEALLFGAGCSFGNEALLFGNRLDTSAETLDQSGPDVVMVTNPAKNEEPS